MAAYSIGEVEQLTGVKAHVLRYWEEHVPFLSPQKDGFGRRVYSARDVQLVMRLKFLVIEQKFSISDACQQIVKENTSSENADVKKELNIIKNDLVELYQLVLNQKG